VPRAGLTPEIVVAEAGLVADDVGFERLTLAAVAERFGVAVPSLYKHVAGLGALRRELATLAVRELGAALAAGIGAVGERDRLRALADAYRGYARAHPGRYAATLRAPDPDHLELVEASERVLDTVLEVLSAYGLADDDAIDATRALRAALHGFVALEALGGFGLPQDVDRSFERLIDILDSALHTWMPNGRPRTGPRVDAIVP
jgi:AcrR family transcriptional regulator